MSRETTAIESGTTILSRVLEAHLERATRQELIDLSSVLTRLLATNFYAPATLVQDMLARDAERESRPST